MPNYGPHQKPRCAQINNQLAQEYFARVLPPDRHYELSIHLINCEDCFLVVQKWGRWTGNGAVSTQGKTLLEYRPGAGTISDNDGTIVSLRELFSRLFQEPSSNEQADNPANNEPSTNKPLNDEAALNEHTVDKRAASEPAVNERSIDEPATNQETIANRGSINERPANDRHDFAGQTQQLLWQLGHQRAALQQSLENTLAELARMNAANRCPQYQAIMALLKGELFGEEWQKLDAHLTDCAKCQQFCLALLDIYSLQKRQELASRQRTLAASEANTDANVSTKAPHAATSLPDLPPDFSIDSPADSQTNSQTKKGTRATMATALTNNQILNSANSMISNDLAAANRVNIGAKWRWPRRSLTAAAMALLLAGGAVYYFRERSLWPPTTPQTNWAIGVTTDRDADANHNENLELVEPSASGQATAPARPLTPELIKEIEGLVKSQASDQAQQLLTPALRQAEASNDRASQAKLLYLQGRIYSDRADFSRAIATLKHAIDVAITINKPDLMVNPEIALANIYHVQDQNVAAAAHARQGLELARKILSPAHEVVSLRILAISEFFAYKSSESEKLLELSIKIAQDKLTADQTIQSYIYLGVLATENRYFRQAKQHFDYALLATSGIKTSQQQAYFGAVINGYYARSQALAGNNRKAIALYRLAIEQASRAGIKQKLALSQLNQGLAESYLAQGSKIQSEQTAKLAAMLAGEALKFCETNNTALSFAIRRQAIERCD
jgi:hypothetical protein